MQWDDLKVALALDDHGTVAGAANALGVTPSTINRRLAALQQALGVRLFDRLRAGVRPTEAGLSLLVHARHVERQTAELELSVLGGDQKLVGSVCLTLPGLLLPLLADAFAVFVHEHPRVELIVRTGDRHADLARREADVAVRLTSRPPDHLVGRRLCSVAFGVYGSQAYFANEPVPHRLVGEDDGEDSPSWAPDGIVATRANHLDWSLAAARRGLGLARLPCFAADLEPDLRRFGPLLPKGRFGVWVLTHERLRRVVRIRALMDAVCAALVAQTDRFEGRRTISASPSRTD